MKPKIILIDATAEKGHVLFVKRLADILDKNFEIELISSPSFCSKVGYHSRLTLTPKLFERPTRYHFVYYQIKILLKVFKHIDRNQVLLFTGFENISFAICSYLFRNKRIYAYVHNNLDKKRLSNFFLGKTNKKTEFIVFEEYLRNFFVTNVRPNVTVIPHPMNFKASFEARTDDYIFAINLTLENNEVREQLLEIKERSNSEILVKLHANSKFEGNLKDITVQRYYSEYLKILANAKLVALQAPYDYRISGVLYECLILNKPVVLLGTKGIFAKEMIKKYPELIFGNYSDLKPPKEHSNRHFLKEHSDDMILDIWTKTFSV